MLIVPTLRVGMHPVTLRVTTAQGLSLALAGGTRSVPGGIPTQSVGTIKKPNQNTETLSSLNAMTCNLAFDLECSQRSMLLAIQQMAELGQLLVDRALEQFSPSPESQIDPE
ncbi:hypothetical protein SAMN04515675_3054 [Pseudomonas costantinii]|uniref:Uncharacterized protein n=1 Tax=Pseudomonas costantinii TaxID=168469 RepID=A0A1H5EG70_9PSED|nr:hypothetical protein SAMN04515675_3054 [Pseudomonas costantinii]